MSVPRFVVSAAIVLVAVLVAPAALVPGINSADLIAVVAPLALVAVVMWPRRTRRSARPVVTVDDPHRGAVSRLDRADGVGVDRSTP